VDFLSEHEALQYNNHPLTDQILGRRMGYHRIILSAHNNQQGSVQLPIDVFL
jgi:hypothetical protein